MHLQASNSRETLLPHQTSAATATCTKSAQVLILNWRELTNAFVSLPPKHQHLSDLTYEADPDMDPVKDLALGAKKVTHPWYREWPVRRFKKIQLQ